MIRLKSIRLINWYGFSQITVPIGFFTLIAGKNGNGKSVLLDAIKYALYGDTVFNKSTENKGSRTVTSYTRGLLDATAGTFMRPVDIMPNVYTHIVLEMEEVEIRRSFILGTAIDTDSSNGFITRRYVLENEKIEDIAHTYEDNGQIIPYSTSELQKVLGVKMMDVKDGVLKFMQRTGLRLNEQQLASFRRKLRSIISYNPDARIDQFIRESVLEVKKVDLTKLVEAKNNIDRLNLNFATIDAEIKELSNIITLFDSLQNVRNVIFADDVKATYKKFLKCEQDIEDAKRKMDIATRRIEEDIKKFEALEADEGKLRKAYYTAKDNLNSLDCAKAIDEAEQALKNGQSEKERLENEKHTLSEFQTRVKELLAWFLEEKQIIELQDILTSLTTDKFSKAQKESSVDYLLKEIKNYRDRILSDITRIEDKLEKNKIHQSKYQQDIINYNSKKTTFSEIPDYVALKDEINKELKKKRYSK